LRCGIETKSRGPEGEVRATRSKGGYRIEGRAFVYIDRDAGRIVMILGYPTDRIAQLS
jgi:hypothetical protein